MRRRRIRYTRRNESVLPSAPQEPEKEKGNGPMDVDNHEYNVKLVLVCEKDDKEINRSDISWSGLRYDGLVHIQRSMIEALIELNNAGIANAKRKGQGELFDELIKD